MKGVLVLLGVGMIILGLSGVSLVPWLGWLDFAIGVLSVFVLFLPSTVDRRVAIATPLLLGGLTFAVWILALAVHAPRLIGWWTFAFGLAYVVTASLPIGAPPTPRA